MKRFLLFSWDQYYPRGGFKDFCADYDDVEAAIAAGNERVAGDGQKRYQVYDIVEGHEVAYEHGEWEA